MGALSFSPSPITTTPVIETEPSTWRMASTAAWSTASLSPKPILRAAAMAAASVTRTSSRARLRSGASPWARASTGTPPGRGWGRRWPSPIFLHRGAGIQGRSGLPYNRWPRPLGCARPPAVGPWRRRSHPVGAKGPLHVRGGGGAVGDSHGHAHGHGHSHVPVPLASSPAGEEQGLRAVKVSAAGLGLTAAVEFAFVAASGSVALLADGLYFLNDMSTT